MGFTPSVFDPCLYYRGDVAFMVYTDDGVFFSPQKASIDQAIKDLQEVGHFMIEDQGDICDYLGVKIEHLHDGRIKMTQPLLIDCLIKDMHFQDNTKPRRTAAHSSKIIHRDLNGQSMDNSFHYCSAFGKLNF